MRYEIRSCLPSQGHYGWEALARCCTLRQARAICSALEDDGPYEAEYNIIDLRTGLEIPRYEVVS